MTIGYHYCGYRRENTKNRVSILSETHYFAYQLSLKSSVYLLEADKVYFSRSPFILVHIYSKPRETAANYTYDGICYVYYYYFSFISIIIFFIILKKTQ